MPLEENPYIVPQFRGEYFAEKLYLFRSQVQKILSFPIIGSFQFLQMNGPFWFLKYSTRANKCYSWLVASPLVFLLKCNFYMLFMRYNQCPKKNLNNRRTLYLRGYGKYNFYQKVQFCLLWAGNPKASGNTRSLLNRNYPLWHRYFCYKYP